MLPAFQSQIILTDSLFKKGVPLGSLGLVSQTMPVLLGLTFPTELKHHWDSLPPKPDWCSFLTWLISLLKTQLFLLFNIFSLHHLQGRLPFILQLNCHSVTWNNSLSSTVSQIQSQLPHKTILCPEVRPLEFKGSDNQVTQQHMLCWARACGTHFHSLSIYSWVPFPLISPRCVVNFYWFSAIGRLEYLNVQIRTTTPQYAQFFIKLRSLH